MNDAKVEGPKVKETAGREKLTRWLSENGVSKHALSKKVLVSPQAVTGWLEGLTRPDSHRRELVCMVTGIQPSLWDLQEDVEKNERERATVQALARGASLASEEEGAPEPMPRRAS